MSSGLFRYTPRQYRHAWASGAFGDRKVEMLRGVLYALSQEPPHGFVVVQVASRLRGLLPADAWTIAEEKTVRLGASRPMPDVAVVRHPERAFLGRLPEPADLRLLVEVADTTWSRDRGPKWRRYAAAGIPEYWIVRLDRRTVHVYTDPDATAREYRRSVRYHDADAVPFEGAALAVAELLPPA
jgi:Uma2 family endonuclease